MPSIPFPMPPLSITSGKDICTNNAFENCLTFYLVKYTARLFSATTNDLSVYEALKLFHCWPLNRISVFFPSSARRQWCSVSPTMSEHFTVIQEKEGEFFGPRQALIHGVRLTFYAPNIDKDFQRDLSRFETRSEDIYVVSFPKSGKAIDWDWITLIVAS